jgi:hypothetical protein
MATAAERPRRVNVMTTYYLDGRPPGMNPECWYVESHECLGALKGDLLPATLMGGQRLAALAGLLFK